MDFSELVIIGSISKNISQKNLEKVLTNLEIGVIIVNVIEKVSTIIGQSKNINQKSWLHCLIYSEKVVIIRYEVNIGRICQA